MTPPEWRRPLLQSQEREQNQQIQQGRQVRPRAGPGPIMVACRNFKQRDWDAGLTRMSRTAILRACLVRGGS